MTVCPQVPIAYLSSHEWPPAATSTTHSLSPRLTLHEVYHWCDGSSFSLMIVNSRVYDRSPCFSGGHRRFEVSSSTRLFMLGYPNIFGARLALGFYCIGSLDILGALEGTPISEREMWREWLWEQQTSMFDVCY